MNNTLSFEKGLRLAKIKGGKFNNNVVYLDKVAKKDEIVKHFKLPTGKGILELMPTNKIDFTDVNFYSGARGAGKSYSIASYLRNYIMLHPKNKIFMFSEGDEDKNLNELVDKWFVIREPPKNENGEPILNYNDENNKYYFPADGIPYVKFDKPACIIFDDIDELEDTKEYKGYSMAYKLMGKLIQNSRKKGITILNTSHFTTDNYKTKKILNGCSSFTWYVNDWTEQINKCLRNKFGLSLEQIKKLKELKDTHSITLFRIVPKVIMTDKEIFILE